MYDRVVIGGGIFGTYSAIVLAKLGFKVLLIEQEKILMNRASYVNQARLHTGLHYPRSISTARESLRHYESFLREFPRAVREFKQIYAISNFNSKTSGKGFLSFIERLGINYDEINPNLFFNRGTVSSAFQVNEPSFSATKLREQLNEIISRNQNIEVFLGTHVTAGEVSSEGATLELDDGSRLSTRGVVIATYAGTNSILKMLGIHSLPLDFELTEVVLGKVNSRMLGTGITVMDGPFWSLMPFGNTELSSLTTVGFTPILKSSQIPSFDCQLKRSGCTPMRLANCNSCEVKPKSNRFHHLQQMKLFLKSDYDFFPTESLFTVKTILASTEVDDARPTIIHKVNDLPVWTVFSGKVSTIFDLEGALG